MIPDMYTREKLALDHRQQLLREAERERAAGELVERSAYSMRHVAAIAGSFLIALGSRLKKFEHPRHQVLLD